MISSQARFAVALLSLAAAAKAPAAIGGGDLEPVEGVYSATGKPEPYEEALRDALIAEHAYRTCQMPGLGASRMSKATSLRRTCRRKFSRRESVYVP